MSVSHLSDLLHQREIGVEVDGELLVPATPVFRVEGTRSFDGEGSGQQAGLQRAVDDHSGAVLHAPGEQVGGRPAGDQGEGWLEGCLLYTSPSPRDGLLSRMP